MSWEHLASSARNALAVISGDPALDQQAIDRLVSVVDGGPLVARALGAPRATTPRRSADSAQPEGDSDEPQP